MIGSLPQLRKMAQSLQTSIDAMIPLSSSVPIKEELNRMVNAAKAIENGLGSIYHDEAQEAFGENR